MHLPRSRLQQVCAALLLTFSLNACASHGIPQTSPSVRTALVQVDVYDRVTGAALPLHTKDARSYIVGTPGHEYAVRIRNSTPARVLVVTSVDGVNVISGDTATPSQSGYVLEPWGSVEIIGWRKSLERTAAFFFTEHQNSYAARTERPNNVGVIGVAVFREKVKPLARDDLQLRRERPAEAERQASEVERPHDGPGAPAPATASAQRDAATAAARPPMQERAAKLLGKLGTGHGRSEASRVQVVSFERATNTPAETVAIQYDRRENLAAMGVLPGPHYTQRDPEPFPGAMRFAPDPHR